MKFEQKYVRCMWSEEMEGNKCFVSDRISDLIRIVEEGLLKGYGRVEQTCSRDFPFRSNGSLWRFAYFDPCFTLKQAREEGKVIERFWESEQEWEEWIDDEFPGDLALYRIKPEEENPVTNRELARWLAQGRGECRLYAMGDVSPYAQTAFRYCDKDGFLPVKGIVLVRNWDDNEWHEPSRAYMGLEE